MISQLPEALKEQAIELMKLDRFVEAKAIHDSWLSDQSQLDLERSVSVAQP